MVDVQTKNAISWAEHARAEGFAAAKAAAVDIALKAHYDNAKREKWPLFAIANAINALKDG